MRVSSLLLSVILIFFVATASAQKASVARVNLPSGETRDQQRLTISCDMPDVGYGIVGLTRREYTIHILRDAADFWRGERFYIEPEFHGWFAWSDQSWYPFLSESDSELLLLWSPRLYFPVANCARYTNGRAVISYKRILSKSNLSTSVIVDTCALFSCPREKRPWDVQYRGCKGVGENAGKPFTYSGLEFDGQRFMVGEARCELIDYKPPRPRENIIGFD